MDTSRLGDDRVVASLLPRELSRHYDLPRPSPACMKSPYTYKLIRPGDRGDLRLEVWPLPSNEDPCFVVELHTNYLGQIEISWISANDLNSRRYNVATNGRLPLAPASGSRNIPEEIRALQAGLAPNQVRPGLRILSSALQSIELFAREQGICLLTIFPLSYHNAIEYEMHGFMYRSGKELMNRIHQGFRRGGPLFEKLDGSSPFRQPWMAGSLRGRSWAIHDGLLGAEWYAPEMYKILGSEYRVDTARGVTW